MPLNVEFTPEAFEDLKGWLKADVKIAKKIYDLVTECARTPFDGIGKPEPLKGNFKSYWSRRINSEHRLIYKVIEDRIYIYSCKGHYE